MLREEDISKGLLADRPTSSGPESLSLLRNAWEEWQLRHCFYAQIRTGLDSLAYIIQTADRRAFGSVVGFIRMCLLLRVRFFVLLARRK